MNKPTIAKVSQDTLKIQAFLEQCIEGVTLSYNEIENKTGVIMNYNGKQYLRTALKRAKIESSCIIGYGIKIADKNDVMPIICNKLGKIDSAVKKSEKSHKNLQSQFFDSLTEKEQRQLLFIGAAFGAIRVAAENGKMVYQSKNKISHTISIPIPQY